MAEPRRAGAMDRMEMDLLLTQWKLWDEQIAALDAEIRKRQAENKTAAVLATIPGCGAYSSLALASRIGDIERFPRPASLAELLGPHAGLSQLGRGHRSAGLDHQARQRHGAFILGQLVLHVLRRDASMRAWYGRIKRRRGSKIARVAVMCRLATIIWHMVKNNEPYVVGGPPRKKFRDGGLKRSRDNSARGRAEGVHYRSVHAGISPASCRRAGGRGPSAGTPYPLAVPESHGKTKTNESRKVRRRIAVASALSRWGRSPRLQVSLRCHLDSALLRSV